MTDRNGVEVSIGDEVQVPQSRIFTMPKGIVFCMDGEFIHFRDHHGVERGMHSENIVVINSDLTVDVGL